jgi:hypothetical protein
MSAFIVSKEHINAILMSSTLIQFQPLTWYHDDVYHSFTLDMADEIGQMLLDENVASVRYRYQDSPLTELPGKTNNEWLFPFRYSPFAHRVPTPVEAIKLIRCYNYQSCEHPQWNSSPAKSFCQALLASLISRVDGYDEAPWEWPHIAPTLEGSVSDV